MAFNHAHDFTMRDPTFNIYQNHHAPLSVDPVKILLRAQAVEASHTSATVGYISKCHPGTRKKVTTDIVNWALRAPGANQGSAPLKSILWFSGPAGAGKTSVMRSVVDRCRGKGISTLSFFFSVRGSGVTSVRPFMATIIHQLVALDPVLKPIIYDAIRNRPTIFRESLEEQVERVLIEPLQSPAFQSQSSAPNIIIAIDGLDECREEWEREHLLNILHYLVTTLPRLIVVVIASRPEFDLRRAFSRPKLNGITESIKLHDYDGSNDTRVFVCDELEEIRQSHPLRGSIPEGWQFEEGVQLLVDKSSGNFIIPATAMKYIRTARRNPVDSLNIILGVLKNPSPTSKPFAELDALYAHILHPPETDLSLVKRILHCIIGISAVKKFSWLSSSFFDDFLGLPPGTTATTLCDLHSILHIPESKNEAIRFHHKTLEDYLLDPERSSDFFQSPYETHLDLTMLCATHLTRWGSNPVVNRSRYIRYSAMFWDDHLKSCIACIDQKSVPATLPNIIMGLDPRNGAMCNFIHGYGFYISSADVAEAVHGALCPEQRCVRLCQLIARVNDCLHECNAFRKTFQSCDFEGRLDALPRFKSTTGLFAPLNPESRIVLDKEWFGQLAGGGRLAGGDKDELDDRDEHGWLDDEVKEKDNQADTMGGSEGRPSNPLSRRKFLDDEVYFADAEGSSESDSEVEIGESDNKEGVGESGDVPRVDTTDENPLLDLITW